MDERLKKALDFSNYMVTLNNQKRVLKEKFFEKKGFPTRKDESWKYTSLNSIVKEDYALFPKSEKTIELRQVKKYFLYDKWQ